MIGETFSLGDQWPSFAPTTKVSGAQAWAAKLSNAEVDNNFWDLLQGVQALETNAVTPVSIEEIVYEGGAITIRLNNGAEYGPLVLPLGTFTDRGIWANSTTYEYLDLW